MTFTSSCRRISSFWKLIHSSLGGISGVGHHHVDAAVGPGRSRQGFHIVGLHHITSLHEASNRAGLFDFLGKLSEPIDPSCPENEVVVPRDKTRARASPMPEEAPVIRATGRLDGGWDSSCTCTAYEAGDRLVGTKWLLCWPLSWHLS